MIAPLIAGMLYCPMFHFENKTDVWNETDQTTLVQVTKEGCKKHNPKTPCLVQFLKSEENVYVAICGAEKIRPEQKPKD